MRNERFTALATWGRKPGTRDALATCSCWSTDDERLIGATYLFVESDVFGFVVLCRDEAGRYRAFENTGPFVTGRVAEAKIQERMVALASSNVPDFPEDQNPPSGIDLFRPMENVKEFNKRYLVLRDHRTQSAAHELLDEISRWFPDKDGNFVRDFQTAGYDARVWELYLFAALTELDFSIDHAYPAPDFCLERENTKLFVEAVTANPTGNMPYGVEGSPPPPPEDFWGFVENDMPQKFGSPLYSKLKKRYWDLEHVRDHPFVIAIADFHAPASMTWSHTALPLYLYGISAEVKTDKYGKRYAAPKPLHAHVVGDKVVPTQFFEQPDTEHVSAVLFSNAGTISKFNRMGVLAGFGDPYVQLIRSGAIHDPTPDALDAIPFHSNIEDGDYRESWADEIEIFHNPNARVPLDPELIPSVTQYSLQGNEVVWRGPSPRILYSRTTAKAYPLPNDEPA